MSSGGKGMYKGWERIKRRDQLVEMTVQIAVAARAHGPRGPLQEPTSRGGRTSPHPRHPAVGTTHVWIP